MRPSLRYFAQLTQHRCADSTTLAAGYARRAAVRSGSCSYKYIAGAAQRAQLHWASRAVQEHDTTRELRSPPHQLGFLNGQGAAHGGVAEASRASREMGEKGEAAGGTRAARHDDTAATPPPYLRAGDAYEGRLTASLSERRDFLTSYPGALEMLVHVEKIVSLCSVNAALVELTC